jgi:hypothetical protein
MAAVSADGSGLRLDPTLELFVQPFDRVRGARCAIGSAAAKRR